MTTNAPVELGKVSEETKGMGSSEPDNPGGPLGEGAL
jgi:hypothetical protein